LRVPNRFRNRSAMAVQFAVEPDPISVEAALYRVLGPYYHFSTIGGAADGLGATRLHMPGGTSWQLIFRVLVDRASLIVVVPQASAGVRWEVEHLLSAQLQTRCLFVLPPVSDDIDTPGLVAGGSELLGQLGIEAPAYNRDGLLFRVGSDCKLSQVLTFDEVWDDTLIQRL
jgi:hypothetical protein